MTGVVSMPRVSVVLPVFNGAAYLSEAVESILGQGQVDLELVAVDDGSQDGSRAILERFARTDERVKIAVSETNTGISAALNRGWRMARAGYVARLDADDVALPGRLYRQVEFLDAHPRVAVVGGSMVVIDAAGLRSSTLRYPNDDRVIRARLPRQNCLAHPTVMIRRAALEAVGGYRFDHVEDYDLWLRLSERYELANLAEPLVLYRQHADQFSLRALEGQARHQVAVRAAARARRRGLADPLAGAAELTPAVLERLEIGEPELAAAVEQAMITWATVLADQGREAEGSELLARVSGSLGPRVARAYAAETEFRRAERLLRSGRRLAGTGHLLLAVRRAPRYAVAKIATSLGDRLSGRGILRST